MSSPFPPQAQLPSAPSTQTRHSQLCGSCGATAAQLSARAARRRIAPKRTSSGTGPWIWGARPWRFLGRSGGLDHWPVQMRRIFRRSNQKHHPNEMGPSPAPLLRADHRASRARPAPRCRPSLSAPDRPRVRRTGGRRGGGAKKRHVDQQRLKNQGGCARWSLKEHETNRTL